jgi:hypothetical protein
VSQIAWGKGLLALLAGLWLASTSTEAAVVPAGGSVTYAFDLSGEQPAAPYTGISFFVEFEDFTDNKTLDITFGFNDPQGMVEIFGPALSTLYNGRHLNTCDPACGRRGTLTFAALGGPITITSVQVTGFNALGETGPVQATVPLPTAMALLLPGLAGLATLRTVRRRYGQATA